MAIGGILACPQDVQGSTSPQYQIYTKTPGFTLTNCTEIIGLLAEVSPSSDYSAWEYE